MNPAFSLLMLCLCFQGVYSQSPVSYTLYHTTASPKIAIHIDIDPIPADAARLIIPRSAPGTYSLTDYLPFVDQVRGLTAAGGVLEGAPGDGSYFSFSGKDQQITGIRYEVDVRLMEERLLDGSSSSKMRNNYLGILGYSVFGYIAGQEDRPIALTIETQAGWPIFSTLRPAVERHSGRESYRAGSYALLADDLDVHIQRETQGRKSFKDAVLGLLEWTATHQRAFGYDDIEPILSAAVGVPLKGVWEAWQGPVKK